MTIIFWLACGCSGGPETLPKPDGPTVSVQMPDIVFTIQLFAKMTAYNAEECLQERPRDKRFNDLVAVRHPCPLRDGERVLASPLGVQTFTFGLSRYGPPISISQARAPRTELEFTDTLTLPDGNAFAYRTWFEQEMWGRPRFNASGEIREPNGTPRLEVRCSDFERCLAMVDTIQIVPVRADGNK